ncbi:iron chelate uptake ABC transporter family permease subunit [Chamaesiphon sp.]|uniref:iron chelate uptake ABC transporter family permease subunit n=1 Tax=Chamaesiphon sp. TaxID=2814140 RepID=UPI003593797A
MREKTTPQPIEDREWMPIHPAPPTTNRQPPTRLPTNKIDRRQIVLGLLFILPIPIFLTSLAMGSVSIPLGDIVTILLGGIPQKESWSDIVIQFRLPKAITAILAGAALSTSGLQLQTLFNNPLAGPSVLGISAGASLGVALVILGTQLFGVSLASLGAIGSYATITAACVGAGIVTGLVIIVARRVQSSTSLLVLGLLFGYGTGAMVELLLYFSTAEPVKSYLNWTTGSFGGVTWEQLPMMSIGILSGLILAILVAPSLNPLLLGETQAQSLGISIERLRLLVLVSSSLLAGIVTAFCGPIAFIGISVPHLCRGLLRTSDLRWLFPAASLVGGSFALVADIIAQMPGGRSVLPINSVTALIGTPIIAWIILHQQRNLSS